MSTTKFMISDDSGPVTELSTSLVRVVTQAAGSDGYGVCWVGKSYGIDPSDVQAQTPTMSA
jgi:hypothetical protein